MRHRTGIMVAAAVASAMLAARGAEAQQVAHAGGAPPLPPAPSAQLAAGTSGDATDGATGTTVVDDGVVNLGVVGGVPGVPPGCIGREYGRPDLFYNYYSQGWCNAVNAQLYLAPRPVPPFVGHTFYTYQPFYPHEMMWTHKNRYHNVYDNGRGLNRTKVTYHPSVTQSLRDFYFNVRIPR